MVAHINFAQICDGEVKNIIDGEDYATVNHNTKCTYGEEAFAVDCVQYPCSRYDKYHDGCFWRVLENGTEEQILPLPTQEQEIDALKRKNMILEATNDELVMAMAELIGGGLDA